MMYTKTELNYLRKLQEEKTSLPIEEYEILRNKIVFYHGHSPLVKSFISFEEANKILDQKKKDLDASIFILQQNKKIPIYLIPASEVPELRRFQEMLWNEEYYNELRKYELVGVSELRKAGCPLDDFLYIQKILYDAPHSYRIILPVILTERDLGKYLRHKNIHKILGIPLMEIIKDLSEEINDNLLKISHEAILLPPFDSLEEIAEMEEIVVQADKEWEESLEELGYSLDIEED